MTEWEKKTGGRLLAIPHNGNLSNGRMFTLSTFAGDPISKSWAGERQKWEPLFEAIQMKGQSESHPSLSTSDEVAVNLPGARERDVVVCVHLHTCQHQ